MQRAPGSIIPDSSVTLYVATSSKGPLDASKLVWLKVKSENTGSLASGTPVILKFLANNFSLETPWRVIELLSPKSITAQPSALLVVADNTLSNELIPDPFTL